MNLLQSNLTETYQQNNTQPILLFTISSSRRAKGVFQKKSLWPNSSSSSSSSHPSLPIGMRKTLRKISSWNGVCSNPHKIQAQNIEEKKRDRRRSEWWALLMRAYLQQLNCCAWLLVCLFVCLLACLLVCLLACLFVCLLACLFCFLACLLL